MQPHAITIDKDFASLLVPHTEAERALLRASLLKEGCQDDLIVWAETNILLDGHERYRLCQEEKLPFQVRRISLPDREAAVQFILARQAARRNLHPVASSYLRGKYYASISKRPGARTNRTSGTGKRRWASEEVARQFGLDESTIRRDWVFARALDAVAEDFGAEFRTLVLTRQSSLSRKAIIGLARMAREERQRFLQRREEERSRPRPPRRTASTGPQDGNGSLNGPLTADAGPTAPHDAQDNRVVTVSTVSAAGPEGHDAADTAGNGATTSLNDPGDASPQENVPDEGLLRQLEDLWHRADPATRLAFLGLPAVQAASRRLAASRPLSA